MKTVLVENLVGGEYLAKPVRLNDNQTLFYEGTCLYMKHIEAILSAGIKEVCIFSPSTLTPKEKRVIKENLKTDCTQKVHDILESYTTYSDGFEDIAETAQTIVEDIFNRDEIVDRVYDIRERNGDLYDHCVTVASLAILTALKMNLSEMEVFDIGVGSLMHDMGLRYLSVPYQDIDIEEEFNADSLFEFKKHTLYGFSSVERETWMSNESKKIILFHHERLDKSGYPFKHVALPIGVRIVAVVDAFDDILCGIGCQRGNVRKALNYLKDGRDKLFEGKIVDFFLEFVAAYPVGTIVITNNGDEAVVIEQNEHYTDKPKIRLIKDRDGNEYPEDKMVDLVEDTNVTINYAKEQN